MSLEVASVPWGLESPLFGGQWTRMMGSEGGRALCCCSSLFMAKWKQEPAVSHVCVESVVWHYGAAC